MQCLIPTKVALRSISTVKVHAYSKVKQKEIFQICKKNLVFIKIYNKNNCAKNIKTMQW